MFKNNKKSQKGFTLIEILIVIGIIALLATIVIIAINPARQFAQARNTQRNSNVNAILNAIGQRIADNKGTFEGTFTIGATTYICGVLPDPLQSITWTMASNATDETGALGCLIPTYLPQGVNEPKPGSSAYTVFSSGTPGRVTIAAPGAELGETISVTR